jgi:hypothetical protein
MRLRSIKTQLVVSVLLVELASAVLGTSLVVLYERHARFRAFEIILRGRAGSLLGAVQDAEDAQDSVMLDGSEINLPHDDIYEVWDENRRVLGHSPGLNIPIGSDFFAASSKQFEKIRIKGTRYQAIRIDGVRVVDPGDKSGGVRRRLTIVYGSPTSPCMGSGCGMFFYFMVRRV